MGTAWRFGQRLWLKAQDESERVEGYATADVGPHGTLDLLVEEGHVGLDLSDADHYDTFPNSGICVAS